jgi:hypothetical protein
MSINLGSISIPINAATKTFAILAKRGAGKTYTAGVMAEEFYSNNIPFVVFDPIDVWWGLRFNKDGKNKGLPIVVFGLEHADIELNRDMGKQIAQAVVKENVSCIISTFGLPKVAQRHLIAEFSDELLRINNTPRHIFVEEAHEFVPQRVHGAMGKCFAAVESLVIMGRNKGIGVTLINQRAATVNKDVLTQLDTLLAFRNVSPQDRKAMKEWVEYHSAEGDFNNFMDSLPSLPTGEGWLWSPEFLGLFKKIKIRKRKTFHPDREKMGDNFEMPQLNQMDIQTFISNFENKIVKSVDKKEPVVPAVISKTNKQEIIELTNNYEADLVKKDTIIQSKNKEIQRLNNIINQIRKLIGNPEQGTPQIVNSSNADMWLKKLGNGGSSRILKFLAENSNNKFTRTQIGLAVGLSSKTGSFRTYIATLKRNRLVLEQNREIYVNPDL